MSAYIEVTYEIEDGYAGASRPQKVKIYYNELYGETAQEIENEIDEIVEEHMREKVYASWDRNQVDFDLILSANKDEDDNED